MQPGCLGAPFVQMPQHSFRFDAVWRVQGGWLRMMVFDALGLSWWMGWEVEHYPCGPLLEAEHKRMLKVFVTLDLRLRSAHGTQRHDHAKRAHLRALDLFVGVQLVAPVPTGRNAETSIFTTGCWGCPQLDSLKLLSNTCVHSSVDSSNIKQCGRCSCRTTNTMTPVLRALQLCSSNCPPSNSIVISKTPRPSS